MTRDSPAGTRILPVSSGVAMTPIQPAHTEGARPQVCRLCRDDETPD